LRIVLLGDSIIGDIGASKFELLLQRMYPGCKIDKSVSSRGSTGCWWYKDENRVQEYVLRHHPDLLIIGGHQRAWRHREHPRRHPAGTRRAALRSAADDSRLRS